MRPDLRGAVRLRNAAWLVAGEMSSRVIAFAATAYVAIVVGPEAFGVLGFALAVASYPMVVVDAGFVDLGARAIARDRESAPELAASVTVARLIVAALLVGAVGALSPWLRPDAQGRLVLVLTSLLVVTAALDPAWVFKGLGAGRPVAASLLGRRLVFAALAFALVAGPGDVTVVPTVQVVGEMVGIAWLGWRIAKWGRARVDLRLGWRTLRSSAGLVATKVFRTSIITFDVILLGFLATDLEVGLYAAPYRLCFLLMALAGAIQVAYLPDVVRTSDEREDTEAARRHLELSAALGLPVAVGCILLAGPLIETLFGAAYLEAVPALRLLLVSLGLLFLFAPVHNVLLARDRLDVENWSMGVAALTNVVLNVMWIPRYGIVGAAGATLVAEAMILLATGAVVWRGLRGALVGAVGRPALACVAMGAAVFPLRDGNLFVGVGVGAAVFLATLTLVGGIPADARAIFSRVGSPTSGA